MVKKLTQTDKENIVNLLKVNEKIVDKEQELIGVVGNVFLSCAAIYFAKNKIALGSILLLLNLGVVVSFINYMKKVTLNVRNFCVYHGVYIGLWSISTSVLSCVFFQKQFISLRTMIIIKVIFLVILFTIVYFLYLIRKIVNNGYKNYSHEEVTWEKISAGSCAVGSFFCDWSIYSKMGTLFLVATMAAIAGGMYYLLKAYCFSLVDEDEIRTSLIKISKENATFNRYGTKKHKKF